MKRGICVIFGFLLLSACKTTDAPTSTSVMMIQSPAFGEGEMIPAKYTCDGENTSPPLVFKEIPNATKSMVLIMDDPDVPKGTWTHWIVWNIDPTTKHISEGGIPPEAVRGTASSGKDTYTGPCPPSGTHHYRFTLTALSKALLLKEGSGLEELEKMMQQYTVTQATLTGIYTR